jgi:hypothetical protein
MVRVGIFFTDIADRPQVAKARLECFGERWPAAAFVAISAVAIPELEVERIEPKAIF